MQVKLLNISLACHLSRETVAMVICVIALPIEYSANE